MGYKYDPDSKRQRRINTPICPKCGKRTRRGVHKNCTSPPSLAPVYPEPKTLEEAGKIPVYYLSTYWLEQLRQERLTMRAVDLRDSAASDELSTQPRR